MYVLLLLLGCPSPSDVECAEGGTGTLHVVIDLPDETWEVAPELEVYDAAGAWVGTVTEPDATLEVLGGGYTLVARRGTVAGAVVGTAHGLLDDTVQQVCVTDGGTTEWSGTWELQPASGKLWVTSGEDASGFDPAALAAGGDAAAELGFHVDLSNDLRGFTVDPTGNLWVATSPTYGARLLVYPPSGAAGGAEPIELGEALFADNVQIQDILFDEKDQLWVLVAGSNRGTVGLWSFAPEVGWAALTTGELPDRPSQQLTVTGLVRAEDMTMGPDDRLWLADFDGNQVLSVGVGHGVDEDPVEVAPDRVITVAWDDETGSHTLESPTALAFDPDGRLWVNYWLSATLARFDTTDGGVRVPDLQAGTRPLDLLSGLAPDRAGAVWYGNDTGSGGEIVALDGDAGTEGSRARAGELPAIDLVFDPAP